MIATLLIASLAATTQADLNAARAVLVKDHPGMSSDVAFANREHAAYAKASRRAGRVTTPEGYRATLMGYANDLRDAHIAFTFKDKPDVRHWAGIVPTLRNGEYIVHSARDASLVGAKMVSCDRMDINRLAKARLGEFRADWNIPAQRANTAPLLLVDDGNPFLTRPERCKLKRADGKTTIVALGWQPSPRAELSPMIAAAVNWGAAGFGVRQFAGGNWIAIEAFDDRAAAVVADAAKLPSAERTVIDLRGNGGGNDVYGRQLAEMLDARKVVLLTDNACFSSCLSVVRMFKQKGAMHVGQETNANTHYSETRRVEMPSGMATFTTPTDVIRDAPYQYGPFKPGTSYDGPMANTTALEAWITNLNTTTN